ncbi:MAG: metallophosphoesterase [Lentisphaeria bacterium]|nr:metallophosphoesterase [Lentisphaeria bacterium]
MKKIIFTALLLCLALINLYAAPWQIYVSSKITQEDAKKISASGNMPPESKKVNIKPGAVFHLAKISGRIKKGTPLRAIAFTTINSPADEERFIGAGADWYFTCYINGEKVLSTEPGGNEFFRISSYNHIGKVKLKKGANHVTLFIRPLVYQWKFAFRLMPDLKMLPVHRADRDRMIAQMFPPANPGLLRKELLHQLSTDSAAISCEFGTPTICGIRFRSASAPEKLLWNTISGKRVVKKIHRFFLSGLKPDTAYTYDIVKLDTNTAKIIPVSSGSFKTAPETGVRHRFIATGDTQISPDERKKTVASMLALPEGKSADFFVSLGDVTSTFVTFAPNYFDSYLDILHQNKFFKPVVMVKGNHEYRGNETEVYNDHFGRSYYTFRHGEVFYIVLDTGEGADTIWKPGNHLLWTDTTQLFEEQIKFLERVISSPACKNAKYRIVLAHASPFKFHAHYYAQSVRKLAEKFFFGTDPRCKIDLWLCGHVHYVSRFDPATDTAYTSRATPYKAKHYSAEDLKEINFTVITNDGPGRGKVRTSVTAVEVTPEGLAVKIMTPEGKVIDESFIRKGKPHEVKSTVLYKLERKHFK